jgi:hypothetical protein
LVVADNPKLRRVTDGRVRRSSHTITELMARYPNVQLATLVEVVPEGANWVQEIFLLILGILA